MPLSGGRIDVTLVETRTDFAETEKGWDNRIKYWDAMLETLEESDEIWLNDETQHNYMNTFYLIKYYKDEVFAVNFKIENDTLALKTWYVVRRIFTQKECGKKNNLKMIWNKRIRVQLLKTLRRILTSGRFFEMVDPQSFRQSGLDSRCYALTWI